METIEQFNKIGVYPELIPFGTGQPNYELRLYIKDFDRSIMLRIGSPNEPENRQLAISRLIELTNIVMEYSDYHLNDSFWKGFDYFEHHSYFKENNIAFQKGMELKDKIKAITNTHFNVLKLSPDKK